MCTTPLLIKSKKFRNLSVPFRNKMQFVPCGQCDECLASRANDIYVRARYEFDSCLKHGGCGFMCCLTYEDYQLPKLNVLGREYMVFNKKHLIDYIKRLRINFDRFYQKNFHRSAPDFKYLITSEYGSDPFRTHRPHYHLLFFFKEFVGYETFKSMFVASMSVRSGRNISSVFGRVYQCDPLDPKKGGIKYSGKYILKDLMFENQRKLIIERIKFYTEYVNNLFNINSLPNDDKEELRNKCIRTSKKYKQAICQYVRPLRHMLQFYMLSNDLGISAIINKYGENVVNMPCLNFEGYPFKIPKLVKTRLATNYGSAKSDELAKQIFINYASRSLDELVSKNIIERSERCKLIEFAKLYIYPLYGNLYLVNPNGVNFREHINYGSSLVDWDLFLNDYTFFDDNGFFDLRNRLIFLLDRYNCEENRLFRSSVAHRKSEEAKEKYRNKKRNNSYKYGSVL